LTKRLVTILVSAAVAVLLAAGTAWGQDAPPADDQLGEAPLAGTEPVTTFVPGEVVVKTEADEYEIRQVDETSLNAVREAAAEIEARDPSVEEAGLNWVYYPEFVPDDPRYDQQDWLRTIRATGAWDISRGSGVRIGVVDTGWQVGKTDLVASLGGQHDFVAEDVEAEGYDYHGTSVAGIAAADTNNGKGVASIGFNAQFVMAKACTDRCLTADIAQAIEWLVQTQGVKIVNLSFGVTYSNGVIDPILRDAIRGALDAGALVVASAGNTGEYTDNHYPSCFEWKEGEPAYNAGTMNEVLGVGAVNDAGTKADFSNTGPCVDLVAPGESVLTTFDVNDPILPEASYAYVNGTSFSAPQLAGTAALIRAQNPALSAEQIAARLQSQAMDKGEPGRDDAYGYGLLNARCSVNPYNTGCNPIVSSVGPPDGATEVAVTTNVRATFSEAMDAQTINTSTFELTEQGSTAPISAAVSYGAKAKKATLNPDADLEPQTTYTATLKGGANGAKDAAGNALATDKVWSFTTAAPPETTIDSGPTGTVTIGSATFEFSSSEANSTFECSLDAALFSTCSSPRSYAGLAEGSHIFEVRATDAAGNTDATPANRTWTVDTAAPVVTIDSKPAALTNDTNTSFGFSSEEADSTFECSLSQGAQPEAFVPCSSPKSYAPLTDGTYTFKVKATDVAGNTGAPASYSFEVDTTKPAAPSKPDLAANSDSGASDTDDVTNDNTPTLTGSAEANSTVELFLLAEGTSLGTAAATATGDYSLTVASDKALTDGTYSVTAKATDGAGNTSAASNARTVIVDSTPPETTIDSGPSGTVNSTSASFSFSSSEAGSSFECKLDDGAFSACTSPKEYVGNLSDGPHTFYVKATDAAGNTDSTPAEQSWSVDTTAPMVAGVTPQDGATNVALGTNVEATFSEEMDKTSVEANGAFELTEQGSTTAIAATVSYDEATKKATLDPNADLDQGATYTATHKGGTGGAKDAAGNPLEADKVWSFTTVEPADTTAPETMIDSGPSGTVSSASATFVFSSDEPGSTFECSLDGALFSTCSSPQQYAGLAEGSHIFEVRATDAAGNTDASPASRSWTVDATAPTVDGVAPQDGATGVSVSSSVEATFSEAMDAQTIISGTTFELTEQSSSVPVAAAVGYDEATKTATLNPDADLKAGTTYMVTMKGGANGAKDVAGNALTADMVWSFTTAAPPDTTP
jgi:subtilisin family serine protease